MLFNSYIFIFLFFPLTIIGYYGLNHFKMYKAAMAFLVGMSLWFYGYNSITYLFILASSILINYVLVHLMCSFQDKKRRLFFLWTGMLLNIGILFYFKYYDFFIENINAGLKSNLPLLHLVLPLGISFYTFQQLSYVIDAYKGDCESYSFLEYAAYVSYFPQLIAGPIVYHSELIPQFRDLSRKKICFANMSKGLYAFSLGLAKKVLIADTFSKIVTIGYGNIADLNSTSALLVMVCYSLQIYFDFSGYCDMAYGMGYMMNIKLPVNFNSPYKAISLSDFWDRWHMTLTRFFTRYIYIPLGGNRRGRARTYLNILIVYLISGLWHGANWTFIVWGMLHGIVCVIERIFGDLKGRQKEASTSTAALGSQTALSVVSRILRMITTFLFVTFAWSIFRAESLSQAWLLWQQLFTGGFGALYQPITAKFQSLIEISFLYRAGLASLMDNQPWLFVTAFTGIVLIASFVLRNTQEKVTTLKLTVTKMLTVILLVLWSILSLSEISEFLYFNF